MIGAARGLVIVAYDQTNTQGVADSVVKWLRRDHGYEVLVVGPGHERTFERLTEEERRRARFFLELDAVSAVLHHTEGLERLDCPKLAWFVDTHKKPHFHARIAEAFDRVFYMMRAWGGLFGERGRWLPVHYDPDLIGPRDLGPPRYDVGFVGSQPRERTRALQEIAARHGLSLLLETTTGPREKELTAQLYAQCRIVFNQHVANDLNFRVVEAQGCGRLLLTDAQNNGQYELFRDREHVVYYKNDRDLEALLLHYLRHDGERERIALAGHALVSKLHTTPARVKELVAVAEALVRERQPRPAVVVGPTLTALVLASELDPTATKGKAHDACALTTALADAGARVEAVTFSAPATMQGVRVQSVTPSPAALRDAETASAYLRGGALLDAASDVVALRTPDVALAIGVDDGLVARALGVPFVVALERVDDAWGSTEEWVCEAATRVLVPDERAWQALVGRRPDWEEKVCVMPSDPASLAALLPAVRTAQAISNVRYDHDYMLKNKYCVRSPEEARLKRVQANVIARTLRPRRALVAGCAAGELLRPLLALGVDAWGFDAAEGLDSFVYPEVRDRVRAFDVADVGRFPFVEAGGRFDTFVAIDLFEHIEEARVDAMLDGVAKSFDKLALVISSSPHFDGHVCVKPFPWWKARLEERGFELLPEPRELDPEERGTYGVRRFEGVREDMSEQLVFFTRKVARPDVSIGVVCRDRADELALTLESTRASLSRSGYDVEWLVFDNASSAAVQRVLDQHPFDLVTRARRNHGLATALDALYRASTGRYFLTLEEDWECLSPTAQWLDVALDTLSEHPDVGVVRLRRLDDDQCGHAKRHRRSVALRHHPWSITPLPDVVETRRVGDQRVYVASAEYANWTNNPTLSRREVRDWLGPFTAYLPDPRDHRPRADHPGLEGAIDLRWRGGPWKVAKLIDGPFAHTGHRTAHVEISS